jgi:hypothetical protein
LPVSVEIQLGLTNQTAMSGAGLLYYDNTDATTKSYYSYIVLGNGQLQLIKRNHEGFETLYSSPTHLVEADKPNKLGIIGDEFSIKLYVNDTLLTTVQDNEGSPEM